MYKNQYEDIHKIRRQKGILSNDSAFKDLFLLTLDFGCLRVVDGQLCDDSCKIS